MKLALPFLAGYLLDLLLGDPPQWPHPVRLLGRACEYWESFLYQTRVAAGALFWLAVMGTALTGVVGLVVLAAFLPRMAGLVLITYLIYAGLATRGLHLESRQVEEALARKNLPEARARLSMIVGRETSQLDAEEIRRAVLETVAENLADGVVAPMFFTLLLGLPGLFLYKAANTMDSMVGYKNYRYRRFGKVAARADDILNFLPARLAALLLVAAAAAGGDPRRAWRILRRDAAKASSPNAGWPEAAMAGALRVRLGGPATYSGQRLDKPFIGDPHTSPLSGENYRQAIRLLYAASLMMAAITFLSLLASGAGVWGILGWWR